MLLKELDKFSYSINRNAAVLILVIAHLISWYHIIVAVVEQRRQRNSSSWVQRSRVVSIDCSSSSVVSLSIGRRPGCWLAFIRIRLSAWGARAGRRWRRWWWIGRSDWRHVAVRVRGLLLWPLRLCLEAVLSTGYICLLSVVVISYGMLYLLLLKLLWMDRRRRLMYIRPHVRRLVYVHNWTRIHIRRLAQIVAAIVDVWTIF